MNQTQIRRIVGATFIYFPVAINIPFAMLTKSFVPGVNYTHPSATITFPHRAPCLNAHS